MHTDAGGARFLVADALGSALALLDPAGAVQTRYTYGAFGTTSTTGTANGNPAQFTGRENDGTGLYYYRARYYSPRLQRFVSEDPIGFAAGDSNLYAYVFNSPSNFTDSSGLVVDTVVDIGSILYDLYRIAVGGRKDRATNLTALGADVAGTFIPGVTGLGTTVRAAKPSLSAYKRALRQVHEQVGKLPKGAPGKFGSPQRGTSKCGYRLDPPHPRAPKGTPESDWHINWWDWTTGKKGRGGRSDTIPVR